MVVVIDMEFHRLSCNSIIIFCLILALCDAQSCHDANKEAQGDNNFQGGQPDPYQTVTRLGSKEWIQCLSILSPL